MRMRCRRQAWLLGPVAIVAMMAFTTSDSRADVPVAGSQGTDTALPATDSQSTVHGRGAFADLAITINQTTNLSNQAVSITWTGGQPTTQGPGRFAGNYLQIMQCWGDDDGSVSGNPGPPPEQCVQGAASGEYGLQSGSLPSGYASTRVISRSNWPNFDPTVGYLDGRTSTVWLPFRSVSGTTVNVQTNPDFNPDVSGGNFWLNPYFSIITTNEIAAAQTGPDSSGAELFKVDTGLESAGLGCGQVVQPVPGGGKKIPKCWIVVVPRGTPTDEDKGTPYEGVADQEGVVTSPISPSAWKNRIAFPLAFKPIDSPCSLASDDRRIAGSELLLPAISSWQPTLCLGGAPLPYSYAPVGDNSARQQLASSLPGAPGMVVVSRPLPAATADPKSPVVYAPLAVSAVVIGFNIERNPRFDAPAAEGQLGGLRVANLYLTPRLVAKLLTQSYRGQITVGDQDPAYPWASRNPIQLALDPDFLQFNPEFELLFMLADRQFGGLQLPAGNSDAAQQVWEWVFADPEALAWLNGQPDQWGMKVNPVYSTSAGLNPTGFAFGTPVPTGFPKSDPFCYQAPARGPKNQIVPAPLCGTDWMPYNRGFADSARIVRVASDRARIINNPFALSASDVWKASPPQKLSQRAILAITDTPAAARFGVQTARLSRAGDNGPNRTFVAPDDVGLAAGVASMRPIADPSVLEPSPTTQSPAAYPLTAIAYAAIKPLSLDAPARAEYATFIEYAAGPGQFPGTADGQLPPGYVPLSDSLKLQAASSAHEVRVMEPVKPGTDGSESTSTTTSVPGPSTTIPTTAQAPTPTTVAPWSNGPGPTTPTVTTSSAVATTTPTTTTTTTTPTTTTTTTITAAYAVVPSYSAGSSNNGSPVTARPATLPAVVPDAATPTSTEPLTSDEIPSSTISPATTVFVSEVILSPEEASLGQPVATSLPRPPVITPTLDLTSNRFAVPGLGAMALGSALCALEITKRPRRRLARVPNGVDVLDEIVLDEIAQD